MSLFLDYRCGGQAEEEAGPTCSAWSEVEHVLAVGYEDRRVAFYAEEGQPLTRAEIEQPRASPTTLAWQPQGRLLGIGWSDGMVSSYAMSRPSADEPQDPKHAPIVTSRVVASNANEHSTRVNFLVWAPGGNRIVTGDDAGTCTVWKTDRGSMKVAASYRRQGRLTDCVFCPPLTTAGGELLASALAPLFFFSSDTGSVCHADDLGHCSEVCALSARVDRLVYYSGRSKLIVVTRNLLMTQLDVDGEGRATPGMKVKLSVAGEAAEKGIQQLQWAGPGLLVTATAEGLVRFWNLAQGENYVLSLASAGAAKSDRATAVGFSPEHRLLAVGTREGKVLQWRFNGEYQEASGGQDGKGLQGARRGARGGDGWEALPMVSLAGEVRELQWCRGAALLAARTTDGIFQLSETVLQHRMTAEVAVVQTGASTVHVEWLVTGGGYASETKEADMGDGYELQVGINFKGLSLGGTEPSCLAVWNGREAEIWELGRLEARRRSHFATSVRALVLLSQADGVSLYCCGEKELQVCNEVGMPGRGRPGAFASEEGSPMLVDANGDFLACVTDRGVIKRYVQKAVHVKQLGAVGRFVHPETGRSLGVVRAVRVNCDGTRVALLADKVRGEGLDVREPDTQLHVYDAARDVVLSHAFGRRYPVGIVWDAEDPKLLTVETRRLRWVREREQKEKEEELAAAAEEAQALERDHAGDEGERPAEAKQGKVVRVGVKSAKSEADGKAAEHDGAEDRARTRRQRTRAAPKSGAAIAAESEAEIEVATAFVTADDGILLQDAFALSPPQDALLGIAVPKLYLSCRTPGGGGPAVQSRVMRDFVGLEDMEPEVKGALLRFSYCLATGNMDAAYRAVKLIRSPGVWKNMAHMCVQTQRLDVAEVCLGNMGHARGAAAVRKARAEVGATDATVVAAVAIQLGMLNDAQRLYREADRHDLLNRLYQAAGLWDRALRVAERHDRIHLKATHHAFARHLESIGEFKAAARHYERAETHRTEVPRMLFEQHRLEDLEKYISRAADPTLQKWWAAYCESVSDFDKARVYYKRAGDHLSRVRLACYNRDLERAAGIIHETKAPAAAYHMARHLEGAGEVREAIVYYTKSGCYNHAIRLARAHGLDAELMSFALKSRPALMVDCAAYFEAKGEMEKAVTLYQKGGDVPKALDLCFKAGGEGRRSMFEVLRNITTELGPGTSPQVLARAADFLIANGEFAKAVALYVAGERRRQAIELCLRHEVKITDEMAEQLTPPNAGPANARKGSRDAGPGGDGDAEGPDGSPEEKLELLNLLAKACKRQGSLHLASKKYTQAGEHLKALKCLIRAGDTKNVMFYASRVGRVQKGILVIAANYLQTLDWHGDGTIMKAIVSFYTKARDWPKLANFYDACAAQEIDEFSDYEKALAALREAAKHAAKGEDGPGKDERIASLQERSFAVERFVEARRLTETDPDEMLRLCGQLLQARETEGSVRSGDVFALCVEHHRRAGEWSHALSLLEDMRARGLPLDPYIQPQVVQAIHKMAGVPLPQAGDSKEEDLESGELDEDIDEDMEDEKFGDDDGDEAKGY